MIKTITQDELKALAQKLVAPVVVELELQTKVALQEVAQLREEMREALVEIRRDQGKLKAAVDLTARRATELQVAQSEARDLAAKDVSIHDLVRRNLSEFKQQLGVLDRREQELNKKLNRVVRATK